MTNSSGKYTYAVGRRKTSVAQVRLFKGDGRSLINGKPIEDVYTIASQKADIVRPLIVTENLGKYYFEASVKGGGSVGQLEAVRHGIALALVKEDETNKPALRVAGLVTRDPRMKERKKVFTRGARRGKQFSKR